MSIRLATLLPGHIPLGIGINGSRRGFAQGFEGKPIPVVVKNATGPELAAELFCAVLGRLLGLPIPEPLIVQDPETNALMFGGVDVSYPNLYQAFRVSPNPSATEIKPIADRLQRWPGLAEVVWFDEWIQNSDRNLSNVLWDGGVGFMFIDHGRSLGVVASSQDVNKLIVILVMPIYNDQVAVQRLKGKILNSAIDFGLQHAELSARELRTCSLVESGQPGEFVKLLALRLPQLAGLVARHFPSPQLTLQLI